MTGSEAEKTATLGGARPGRPAGPGALGLRVVEWGAGIAGAVAGLLLADNGAEVIVVEPPGGCELRYSSWWPTLSRGKTSLVVDPSDPGAVKDLGDLLGSIDVAVHGYRKGAAPLAVLDGPDCAEDARRSSLISCAITGFGGSGALSELPADDLLVSAFTGRCANQVGWHDGPCYLTHLVPSVVAGLIAVQGLMAALVAGAGQRTGQRLETSLAAAALAVSELVEVGDVAMARHLDRRPQGTSPLYSLYECGDGEWIQLGCLHAGFVERAIEVLGISAQVAPLRALPGFEDGVVPTTKQVRDPFSAAVAGALVTRPRHDWVERLSSADVPVAPVLRSEEFLTHPQAQANGVALVEDEVFGEVLGPGPFARFRGLTPGGGGTRASGPDGANSTTGQQLPPVHPSPRRPAGPRNGPLQGVTVVELANLIAGPMAGRCLADLGARVVKLEPLEGDLFRQQGAPEFEALNAGKQSIAMNVKRPEGLAAARALLSQADVFLNNLRPGAVDRLGLGYEALRALNPRLIFCQVSAFGLKGPLATLPGGDPLAGALTGMQSAQGGYGERPVYTYGAPIDYTSGFLAAAAVLIGLHRRGPSGLGDFVDTSLLDAGALLNAGAMTAYAGRPPRDDLPKGQYRRNALNGLYRTASGWVAIAIVGADEWDHFRQAVGPGAPQLPPKTDACSDDDLAHVLSDVLLSRDSEFWFRTLSAAGLSCVAVRPKSEVGLSDPWVVTNGWVARHTSPGRKSVSFIDNWLAMSHGTCHSRGAAPGLGEHTDDVLDSVGMDPELRRHLRRSGTVSGGSI